MVNSNPNTVPPKSQATNQSKGKSGRKSPFKNLFKKKPEEKAEAFPSVRDDFEEARDIFDSIEAEESRSLNTLSELDDDSIGSGTQGDSVGLTDEEESHGQTEDNEHPTDGLTKCVAITNLEGDETGLVLCTQPNDAKPEKCNHVFISVKVS
jgi:hypothetical protein